MKLRKYTSYGYKIDVIPVKDAPELYIIRLYDVESNDQYRYHHNVFKLNNEFDDHITHDVVWTVWNIEVQSEVTTMVTLRLENGKLKASLYHP